LPANASEAARAAWLALIAATSGASAPAKVTSFDLTFNVHVRPPGEGLHTIEDARYRYTEPGWLHETLGAGVARLRGPRGDWSVTNGTAVKLQGSDYATDVKEL